MYSLVVLVSPFGWLLSEVERSLVVVFGAAHKGLVGQSNAGGSETHGVFRGHPHIAPAGRVCVCVCVWGVHGGSFSTNEQMY